jgi:hypothetical protein
MNAAGRRGIVAPSTQPFFRGFAGDQVLLIAAQLDGSRQLRRALEMFGEQLDAQDIGFDGAPPLVAQRQVIDLTAAQRCDGLAMDANHDAAGR